MFMFYFRAHKMLLKTFEQIQVNARSGRHVVYCVLGALLAKKRNLRQLWLRDDIEDMMVIILPSKWPSGTRSPK